METPAASLITEPVSERYTHTHLNTYKFVSSVAHATRPFPPDPPTSLNVGETVAQRKRRTLVAPDMNLSLDQSEGSVLSDDLLETPDDLDINVDDMETPDETDSLEFINNGNDLEWEGQPRLKCWETLVDRCIVAHVVFYLHGIVLPGVPSVMSCSDILASPFVFATVGFKKTKMKD